MSHSLIHLLVPASVVGGNREIVYAYEALAHTTRRWQWSPM